MKKIIQAGFIIIFSLLISSLFAEKVPEKFIKRLDVKSVASGCLPGSGFRYLDIGNVRTRINTGGDMWWDFESAQYEIPKGSGKMSMFAASLWIGGIDVNNQLKLAALRYRQVGNDYWPGPLTIDGSAAINSEICAYYDKHFVITRAEVDEHIVRWNDPDYTMPESIRKWPAHPEDVTDLSQMQSYYLAPFYDYTGSGTYEPHLGDYPYYDLTGELCQTLTPTADALYYHPTDPNNWLYGILSDQVIKGDETLWWVFNDKGNIHTETGGDAIGMEIRGQAFAFATNDEINNMTFYSYEVINRSTFTLRETYFSQWVDPDLGFHLDDFIGCDVTRGLGYCYNGRPSDGTGQPWSYGDQPPAIGVDFFQGPYMDRILPGEPLYGQDRPSAFDENHNLLPCDIIREMHYPEAINGVNFGDGIANNERFGMRRFTYFNNTTGLPPFMTDPQVAIDYYNYLRGIWKDGTRMIYGGLGHPETQGFGPVTDFLFPGDSDPCNWGTHFEDPNSPYVWTEENAGNPPNDRRFLQSAGPFTLRPGAVNYITVGIPWARAASGGPWASVELLRVVDDKCQALFDNCFQVVDGPAAPDLTFREMDKELIVYITNRPRNDAGNNFNEQYTEVDYNITTGDSVYVFEGYQVYQLRSASVGPNDLKDPNLARLVFQCDNKNGVSKLVNYYYDQSLGANIPVLEVNGTDQGIRNSFRLIVDAFANQPLVNHKQYYYMALAYAYNEYEKYSDDPNAQEPGVQSLNGQKRPYLAGRKNIMSYTAIPHIPVGPVVATSNYGDGMKLTRLQGQGSGGNILELTKETVEEILSKPPAHRTTNLLGNPNYPISYNPTYQEGFGPVKIKVIDPLNVTDANFILAFDQMYRQKVFNVTKGAFAYNPGGDTASMLVSTWKLINTGTLDTAYSSKSIITFTEQIFPELGIAVEIGQVFPPGSVKVGETPDPGGNVSRYAALANNNGFLGSTIVGESNADLWLWGVPDIDGGGPFNWIRSGTQSEGAPDWDASTGNFRDPNSVYETVLGGTWAPYHLVAYSGQDPVAQSSPGHSLVSKQFQTLTEIASVDVVITPDKSKWTRSVVVEMSPEAGLAQNRTPKYQIRSAPSIDKDGNSADPTATPSNNPNDPHYISATGMGWFPGYAINLETGERLNIMYGENSWLVGENGRDMKWNPTSNILNEAGYVFGGMHYIYIMGSRRMPPQFPAALQDPFAPAYDAGAWLRHILSLSVVYQRFAWSTAMWVNMPITIPGEEFLSSELNVKLRVSKPYARNYATFPLRDTLALQTDTANNNFPMYSFSTTGVATVKNDLAKAKNDLDLINVVPNPYYAYSAYEVNQLDNRIKITNLPRKCVVTIYTVNGTFIRQFTKDTDAITSIDWDLKNYAGIPIAGGLYIIHINADALGERTIKWFGSLRPIDLNAF